jgi:uncharacterized protein YaiI (UPF0178 family)
MAIRIVKLKDPSLKLLRADGSWGNSQERQTLIFMSQKIDLARIFDLETHVSERRELHLMAGTTSIFTDANIDGMDPIRIEIMNQMRRDGKQPEKPDGTLYSDTEMLLMPFSKLVELYKSTQASTNTDPLRNEIMNKMKREGKQPKKPDGTVYSDTEMLLMPLSKLQQLYNSTPAYGSGPRTMSASRSLSEIFDSENDRRYPPKTNL